MVEKGNIIRWKISHRVLYRHHSWYSRLTRSPHDTACPPWTSSRCALADQDLIFYSFLTHWLTLTHPWVTLDSFLNHSWFMDSFLTHCWLILDSLLTHSDLPLNHSWLIDSFLTHYWITLDSLNHPWLTIDSSLTHYWLTLTHSWLIHSSLPHNRLLLTHLIPPRLTLDSLWLTLNSPIPDSLLTHYSSLAHTS